VKNDDDERKEYKPVEDIGMLQKRYSVKKAEGAFMIERAVEEDEGNYSCTLLVKGGSTVVDSQIILVVGMVSKVRKIKFHQIYFFLF
jgi:hypothetical protein